MLKAFLPCNIKIDFPKSKMVSFTQILHRDGVWIYILVYSGETKYLCLFLILVLTGNVGVRGLCLLTFGMVLQYIVTKLCCYQDKDSLSNCNLY